MTRRSYIQIAGKLYEKGTEPQEERGRAPLVMPDIAPYRSPITGEIISSRPKQHAHMRQHEVTRREDYSDSYYQKKYHERQQAKNCATPQDRAHRIESLKQALESKR